MSSRTSKKKAERRRLRRERNKAKEEIDKAKAIKNGKIIKEEHGQGMYSITYARRVANVLIDIINNAPDKFKAIMKYKAKIFDLLVYWPREFCAYRNNGYGKTLDDFTGNPRSVILYRILLGFIENYYNVVYKYLKKSEINSNGNKRVNFS